VYIIHRWVEEEGACKKIAVQPVQLQVLQN